MSGISITAIILLLAFSFSTIPTVYASDAEQRIRFVVQVPTKHFGADIYLASNANNWNPADQRWQLRPGSSDQPGRYSIEIPVPAIPENGLEYKFTKGSWATVELDGERRDTQNRLLRSEELPREKAVYELAIAIPAFADDRADEPARSTVVGTLEVFDFTSEILSNSRKIRVWLPEAYATEPHRQFPVLYMHDGQNCFDSATSAFGNEWRIDETLTELIEAGKVPPMIVVGIDNAGPDRSWEYNASYSTFRDRKPYGEKYVSMLVDELMPEVEHRYRVMTGPQHTSLGGSSFGGNITMLAAMERPGVFGCLLVESPAVPVVGPRFLHAIQSFGSKSSWTPKSEQFTGRVFLAMGTKETANDEYNAQLVALMDELATAFSKEQHLVEVEDGAVHNEVAWAARFPRAARYLFGG